MATQTDRDKILSLASHQAVVRPKDIGPTSTSRRALGRLVREGKLVRLGTGLYSLSDADFGAKISLAEAGARLPDGVVCLLSALRFHELTTENPSEIWMAVGHKRPLHIDHPPVRVVRMSGDSFTSGIEEYVVEGIAVQVFSVAKTIADCFKFRSTVGIDVATEALREAWRGRRFEMDELWRQAKATRMLNVMRPYLEML